MEEKILSLNDVRSALIATALSDVFWRLTDEELFSARFQEHLMLDSDDLSNFIRQLQFQTGIIVPDNRFDTVGDLLMFVNGN